MDLDTEIDRMITGALKKLVMDLAIQMLEYFEYDIIETDDNGYEGITRDVLDVTFDKERSVIRIKLEGTTDNDILRNKLKVARDNIEYALEEM